jgi:hypothetical protein
MDASMVGLPGGPLGGLDAQGAIRRMLEQFRQLPLQPVRWHSMITLIEP